MDTWIKLYRKFTEWEWFNVSEMVHLFIYLLINANNSENEWRGVKVKRGQLITGRKILHEKTGISEQTLRTCLKRLENTKEITIQSTNLYSIITICKYNDYQPEKLNANQPTNQQLTNDQPATNQQLTTIKEEEEEKKEKKKKYAEFVSMKEEEYNKLISAHGIDNTTNLINTLNVYKGSTGKRYKSDYMTILNWVIDKLKKESKYINQAGKQMMV